MPTSIDPPLADDEIECGHCGARFYIGLTRCPNCGVNLYEPEDEPDQPRSRPTNSNHKSLLDRLDRIVHKVTKRPYPADELFGAAINQASLFDDLLRKVGGDHSAAERLVEYEHRAQPQGNQITWIENAIRRWEQDNRASGIKEPED